MIGKPVSPVDMAQDAARSMTEAQRLALATQWVNDAVDATSLLQLARICRAAEAASMDLHRARFEEDAG